MNEIKEGQQVVITPGANTKEHKFKKAKAKKTYIGQVTDVNEDSIDVTVFDNGGMVFLKNIKHSSTAKKDGSKWDYKEGEAPASAKK